MNEIGAIAGVQQPLGGSATAGADGAGFAALVALLAVGGAVQPPVQTADPSGSGAAGGPGTGGVLAASLSGMPDGASLRIPSGMLANGSPMEVPDLPPAGHAGGPAAASPLRGGVAGMTGLAGPAVSPQTGSGNAEEASAQGEAVSSPIPSPDPAAALDRAVRSFGLSPTPLRSGTSSSPAADPSGLAVTASLPGAQQAEGLRRRSSLPSASDRVKAQSLAAGEPSSVPALQVPATAPSKPARLAAARPEGRHGAGSETREAASGPALSGRSHVTPMPGFSAADSGAADPTLPEAGALDPGAQQLRGSSPTSHAHTLPPRAPIMRPVPIHQLGIFLHQAAAAGRSSRLLVRLEPESLGQLEMSLRFHDDGKVSASFIAQHGDALQLLRAEAPSFARIFTQHGLELAAGGLDFGLMKGDGQAGGFTSDREEEGAYGNRFAAPSGDGMDRLPRALAVGLLDLTV